MHIFVCSVFILGSSALISHFIWTQSKVRKEGGRERKEGGKERKRKGERKTDKEQKRAQDDEREREIGRTGECEKGGSEE